MEGSTVPDDKSVEEKHRRSTDDRCEGEEGLRILSVDKVTVEKIVLETDKSREVLLTKSESIKRVSELKKTLLIRPRTAQEKFSSSKSGTNRVSASCRDTSSSRIRLKFGNNVTTTSSEKKQTGVKGISKLPISRLQKSGNVTTLNERRISPIKLTKSSSIGNLIGRVKNPARVYKVPPPKVSNKFEHSIAKRSELGGDSSKEEAVTKEEKCTKEDEAGSESRDRKVDEEEPKKEVSKEHEADPKSVAQNRLEKSQSKIERLQRNLWTKINASTAETYKLRLFDLQANALVRDLDLNENVTKGTFDKEFLERHNFDKKLRIEENLQPLEADLDYVTDAERTRVVEEIERKIDKPRYSRKVSEVEKRWSSEFLEQNSSGSSKSSYVEELGSISSHESIVAVDVGRSDQIHGNCDEGLEKCERSLAKLEPEEILEDTVSTVDSASSFEDRIKAVDEDLDEKVEEIADENESKDSTLKESSIISCRTKGSSSVEPSNDVVGQSRKWSGEDKDDTLEDSRGSDKVKADSKDEGKRIFNLREAEEELLGATDNKRNATRNISLALDQSEGFRGSTNVNSNELKKIVATSFDRREEGERKEEEQSTAGPKVIVDGDTKSVVLPTETHLQKDGYANIIKEFTMEAETSKVPKEEKKRKGFRRLLPGLFSPKDSRKEYKKDQKERKKREEKRFSQHQQNGNYTRSPDTMNLNEDIKRNVKLDASLNSSVIEERLNEIKQELFPEQGIITSTPDHFLQIDRSLLQDVRSPRTCTTNSSLSSIAPDDKWMDQNIISGSPDMRQLKQRKLENDRKCSLERKHSLQETTRPRFLRNHGPTGRISAPPGGRFLIRPRAVHPVDRPLPAIPQRIEFSHYENDKQQTHRHACGDVSHGRRSSDVQGYNPCPAMDRDYENGIRLYENSGGPEKSEVGAGNHSVDSGFNLTPVSAQVKITRQFIVNQNQKAPLIERSPKYSPNSSHRSGDYADSSYTPNSSQKSEFSPSSSKSGEYYLGSPRNSARTSPNDSINDRREQLYESKQQSPKTSYSISPRTTVRSKVERVYNEAPTSRCDNNRSPERTRLPETCETCSPVSRSFNESGSSPIHSNSANRQEPTYAQRCSPNIPMSSNLAKLRANVENAESRTDVPSIYVDENVTERLSSANSPLIRMASPVSIVRRVGSPILVSPTRAQRVTSPLTIVPPNRVQSPIPSPIAPTISISSNGIPIAPRMRPLSPGARSIGTPISSPITNARSRMNSGSESYVSMSSKRSQPNDQILIASPKRETTYEPQNRRPAARLKSDCPESPIPMADSPSQVLGSRQSIRQTVAERPEHCKSPAVGSQASKPANASMEPVYDSRQSPRRSLTSRRTMSPSSMGSTPSPKSIQRPEPIYVQRQHAQRALSPVRVPIPLGIQQQSVRTSPRVMPEQGRTMSPDRSRPGDFEQGRIHVESKASVVQGIASTTKCSQERERDHSNNEQIYAGGQIRQPLIQIPTVSPLRNTEPTVYVQRQDGDVQRVSAPRKTQRAMYSFRQSKLSENLQEQVHVSRSGAHREPVYSQRHQLPLQDPAYSQKGCESVYGQHPNRQQSSPSKRQTMQHLEAFYWQQKALEAQRKSMTSPSSLNRQNETKLELPEVREAMYWQQLKMLDEEQQKRIYEQNLMEERNDPLYWRRKLQSPPTLPTIGNASRHGSSPNLINQSLSLPSNTDQLYWRSKLQQPKPNPVGKPPIMSQKGQHQPVLVVRPQPAFQEHDRSNQKILQLDGQKSDKQDTMPPRSKSVSPHFVRSDERRSLSLPRKTTETDDGGFLRTNRDKSTIASLRKPETPPIYEEDPEVDRKPPPIFKRGSLISNSSSSVDYGTVGPKRVSFSNQTNSPEVGAGIWPTKHGMAPEPPTRKHKVDRVSATSESDSVFLHEEENQNNANTNVYGNILARSISLQTESSGGNYESFDVSNISNSLNFEQEYDADRPLPPPPRESSWVARCAINTKDQPRGESSAKVDFNRSVGSTSCRKWPDLNESESGSEAGEVHQRQEEEWNPDGKGRQTNDTGGSGRGEGEGGPNDLPGGRRGAGGGGSRSSGGTGSGSIGRSRDEPRRHTLSGDHQPSLHHQQFNAQQLHLLHPHHLPPPHGQYGTPPNRHTTMDLEMGTKSRQRKSPLPRGYPPPSSAMLFDDDPGIMSEVETSSTGFRRGGKQRSSLPVVRTPSKTLERPLGLVFLQYRNETKRALLPNEITSIDTVKALFVRSFPKQLTMEYLDSPHVKVYIHDSNKDMFYELEDLRSHLRDIRDRSVLRLFESDGGAGMPGPLGALGGSAGLPSHWEDQSYFSEPEFDSEFQHQHIHKSKTAKNSTSGSGGYYMGSSSTLPRGGPLLRAYSPAVPSVVAGPNSTPNQPKTLNTPGGGGVAPAKPLRSYQCGKSPLGSLGGSARFSRDSSVSLYSIPDRLHGESGYMSSPERGGGVGTGTGRYPSGPYSAGSSYEDPYYSQYSGTVTPVIDEEASDTELLEESYSLYGVKPPGRPPSGPPRSPFPPGAPLPSGGQPYDATRIRVEHMERQLANLTGLVQKALTHAPHTSPSPRDYLQVPAGRDPYRTTGVGDEFDKHSSSSSASLPDKSVSFEKSVSFSDEPPDMNSPKQHSPQHAADTKPTKPAIKSSTLPRMSSQERERHKPTPPPKPAALAAGQYVYRDLALTPEMYNQLRGLQKKAKDLRQEVRNLRRMSQAQAHTVRETIRDTFITIRAMLLSGGDAAWASGDTEKIRLSREEDLYKQEMIRLEKDLTELESTVEELRGNVINRKTRVNMSDVENMALILSKSSKTVADLKVRFPSLQEGMKGLLSSEMEKVVREEKFLKEEPERLESALRRCKKLTGTLVTLKRLASVQEQRLPNAVSVETEETPPITPTSAQHSKATTPVPAERTVVGSASVIGGGSYVVDSSAPHQQRPENALDALLDELQTFSRPASQLSQASSIGHLTNHPPNLSEIGRSASQVVQTNRPPSMSDIGRKGSIDSSTSLAIVTPGHTNTLRRLHSYPSSSDTDTSPPIARLQVSDGCTPPQKPPVPERNTELLQLATSRRVPPPPPPRTSSRSPLASPTSPQLLPRNPAGTLRRGRGNVKESGKPPMALPPNVNMTDEQIPPNNILSTSNSSSCESINSQEGMQNKKGRQEQLEQRHQELLRKQKALQEQYARLQQLQRNASGVTTVPPAPPDLLKKTGSESNLLAKMGLGLSTASSGSLTSLTTKTSQEQSVPQSQNVSGGQTTTNKIYETDIL